MRRTSFTTCGLPAMAMALALVGMWTVEAVAAVELRGDSSCVSTADLVTRVNKVLESSSQGREIDLLVVVEANDNPESTDLRVRAVSGPGEAVLERSYQIPPGDCPSAPDLVATVVQRFLAKVPLEVWTLDRSPVKPVPPPATLVPGVETTVPPDDESSDESSNESSDESSNESSNGTAMDLAMRAGLNSDWASFGGSLDLGVQAFIGEKSHRFTIGCLLRASAPQSLGDGAVFTSSALVSLRWQYRFDRVAVAAEARVGAIMIAGTGHDENYATRLAWFEVVGAATWDLGPVAFGPHVAISPLRHRGKMKDTGAVLDVSSLRVGLLIELPIAQTIL